MTSSTQSRSCPDHCQVSDFDNLKHLLKYVNQPIDFVFVVNPQVPVPNSQGLIPVGIVSYSDSDWAGCQKSRESTSGSLIAAATARSSTHAMTMRLTLPAASRPVKAQNSVCIWEDSSVWELESSESAMISVSLWDHTTDVWVRRQTVGSGYRISWGACTIVSPFDSSTGVLRKADVTSDTAKLYLWSWLIIKLICRCLRCMSILRFFCQWLEWSLSNETSLENTSGRPNDPERFFDLSLIFMRKKPERNRIIYLMTWTAERSELLLETWWLPWFPSLSILSLEDLPDIIFEVWDLEATEALDVLLIVWLITVEWLFFIDL